MKTRGICLLHVGLIAALALPACRESTPAASTKNGEPAAHSADEPPHWSYEGETGPEHWAELDPAWAIAATGHQQSPIDIRTDDVKPDDGPQLEFDYRPTHVELVNNGHTIELIYEGGSAIVLDGKRYDLQQFHFHAPSEHTIDGEHAEMEMHLVHRSAEGELAVVGIFIDEGDHDVAMETLWTRLPQEPGERVVLADAFVNADQMLPRDRRYFRYQGSLTTPPCTEGVAWIVMRERRVASREQLDQFESLYDGTNRPIQALYGRPVVASE